MVVADADLGPTPLSAHLYCENKIIGTMFVCHYQITTAPMSLIDMTDHDFNTGATS